MKNECAPWSSCINVTLGLVALVFHSWTYKYLIDIGQSLNK
jgi:hypothetical protein